MPFLALSRQPGSAVPPTKQDELGAAITPHPTRARNSSGSFSTSVATAVAAPAVPLGQVQQGLAHGESETIVLQRLRRGGREQRRQSLMAQSLACELLQLAGPEDMQDFLASLILCECAYKKVELPQEELLSTISAMLGAFPPGWVELDTVQISRSDLQQHYLLATGGDAMYVAFMGTKQPRDLVTDATILHEAVWAESVALAADKQSVPAAHGGFLQRARAINVEQLHELASASGRRLVLCGHSLGGAVAKLSTLRLLRDRPEWPAPRVKCMCFATPAIGNAALADLVKNAGWGSHFKTYFLPEDQVMRLMSFSQRSSSASASSPSGLGSATAAAAAAGASLGRTTSGTGSGVAPSTPVTGSPRGGFSVLNSWKWPLAWNSVAAAAGSSVDEGGVSLVSSVDATEAAIDDILSPAPSILQRSASDSELEAAGSCRSAAGSMSRSHSINALDLADMRAEGVGKPSSHPFNLGLAFALQHRRAVRAVTRLASRARIPLPIPRAYYTFGAQVYIHSSHAYLSDQPLSKNLASPAAEPMGPTPAPSAQTLAAASMASFDAADGGSTGTVLTSGASAPAAVPSDLSRSVKGPFNFHRMVAHRLRVLSVIASVLPEEQRAQHYARVTASTAAVAALAAGTAAPASTAPSSAPSFTNTPTGTAATIIAATSPTSVSSPGPKVAGLGAPAPAGRAARTLPSQGGSKRSAPASAAALAPATAAAPALCLQSEGLYPRISALRVVARLPLEEGFDDVSTSAASAASASSPATRSSFPPAPRSASSPVLGTAAAPGTASTSGRKLAGLWGKKGEDQVPLLLEVEGHNLQYCHHVIARLSTTPASTSQVPSSSALPTEVLQVVAGAAGEGHHPLARLQSRLHQVAGSVGRYIGRSRSPSAHGSVAEQATSRMVLRVMVPRSAVQQLREQSYAAAMGAEMGFQRADGAAGSVPVQMAGPATSASSSSSSFSASPFAQQQPAALLRLELRSHFHEDEAEVRVQPYKAAVLGTSLTAATLLQAALLHSPVSQPQSQVKAQAQGNTPAAGAGTKTPGTAAQPGRTGVRGGLPDAAVLATAATAMQGALSWWLRPQPMHWAVRLWRAPGTSSATTPAGGASAGASLAASDAPSPATGAEAQGQTAPVTPHDGAPAAGLSLPTLLMRRHSGPPDASSTLLSMPSVLELNASLSTLSALTLDEQSCSSSLTGGYSSAASVCGGSDSEDDAATAALLSAWQREASLGVGMGMGKRKTGGGQEGGELPVGNRLTHTHLRQLAMLQPVAALLLLMRFLGQATARIATARLSAVHTLARGRGRAAAASSAAAPGAGSGGRAGAALLMRRRAATYAASVVMLQRLDPGNLSGTAGSSSGSASSQAGKVPSLWFPGMRFLAGLGSQGRYLQMMSSMLRSRPWGTTTQSATKALVSDASPLTPLLLSPNGMRSPGSCATSMADQADELELSPLLAAAKQLEELPILSPTKALSRRGSREVLSSTAAPADLASTSHAPLRTAASMPAAAAGDPQAVGDAGGTKAPGRSQGGAKAPLHMLRAGHVGGPTKGLGRALRQRASAAAQLGVPAQTLCLAGSLLVHNVLASTPSTSPFVVLRALTASLRRQAARLRRQYLSGSLLQWNLPAAAGAAAAAAAAPAAAATAPQQRRSGFNPLQPAGALLHVYNFLRGIPFWIQQRRSRGALAFEQDYQVLLVAASTLDSPRLLQGRDFARLALRANAARVTLLPVLLTSPLVPRQQEQRARAALGAACGVDASAVKTVEVDHALLQLQGPWQDEGQAVPGSNGLERAKAVAAHVSGVASVQKQLQALLRQQQQLHVPQQQQQSAPSGVLRSSAPCMFNK